ncbi:MAG: hypothetical protein J0L94_01650 [Rhodothermia bacterium]|nr:hypothetical protein [Rhodothermia bacterium]
MCLFLFLSACDNGNPSPEEITPTSIPMKDEWTGNWAYMDGAFRYNLVLSKPDQYRIYTAFLPTDGTVQHWYEDWGTVTLQKPLTHTPDRYPMIFSRTDGLATTLAPAKSFSSGESWTWQVTFKGDSLLIAQSCPPYIRCVTPIYKRIKP